MGGGWFTRGQLYFVLKNAIYAGRIPHKDTSYPGQHPAIIDEEQWHQVQQQLADHTQGGTRQRSVQPSLLAGRILDAQGQAMVATHASKNTVRYRYYVSQPLHAGVSKQGLRLPAREVERAIKEQVAGLCADPLQLAGHLGLTLTPALLRHLDAHCKELALQLRSRSAGPLRDLIHQVRASEDALEVAIDTARLASLLGCGLPSPAPALTLTFPMRFTRSGQALRLIQENGAFTPGLVNDALVRMLVQAHAWWRILQEGTIDIRTLAAREGISEAYVSRSLRAVFLAPKVTAAILAGRHKAEVSAAALRERGGIPAHWAEQERVLLPDDGL
jgi:hypothetical protein